MRQPSSTAWNLAALRSYIKASHADESELQELVRSIERSCRIFGYHMISARDAMKGTIPTDSSNTYTETMLAIFGASDRQTEFEWAKIANESHLIACLHTTRGTWDIYAQLLNRLVVSPPLPIDKCDIRQVAKLLPASALRDRIDVLLASHWYDYISAFINTTKHRQLVEHLTSISFVEERAGIRVGAFNYNGKSFTPYWDTEVLEGAIEVNNSVIDCGRILNAHLGA